MELREKLEILADAAKYDVSCSSSGSRRKNTRNGIGNAHQSGICHSWSDDGRCISLLKVLFTNHCIYDCKYCINRRSNDRKRASFTPREIADLTINFYRRNYIEGLFLSSGILGSRDRTMEKLIEVAKILRHEYNFNGYIHMKAIPGASEYLIDEMANLVDRMSLNIELPTNRTLALLAPEKKTDDIYRPMSHISENLAIRKIEKKKFKSAPSYVPAGQTTQMIVGAGGEDDYSIMQKAQHLYDEFSLKRVYYSAYVPVGDPAFISGIKEVELLREHRIYQADFLLRFYNFRADEILSKNFPNFDKNLDPKLNFAINNYNDPIEINRASKEELLKIPGLGPRSVTKIIRARRSFKLRYDDLKTMGISTKRAINFITVDGEYRGRHFDSSEALRDYFTRGSFEQLSFF